MPLIKKNIILFLLALIPFLIPTRVDAVEKNPSFFSAIPILPLIVLVILITIAGVFFYLKIKKGKETPYNLPLSSPSPPNSSPTISSPLPTSTLTPERDFDSSVKAVNPPIAEFKEPIPSTPSQEPSSLSPPASPSPTLTSTSPKLPFSSPVLIGTVFVVLLISVLTTAFILTKKSKKPTLFPTSACIPKEDVTGARNEACCCQDSDCPSGQTCDIPNGYCKSGKSCNDHGQSGNQYPAGCCYNTDLGEYRRCPTPQTCDIPNGACGPGGKSCNESPGQKHRECQYDASQGKNICAWVSGGGADKCTSNEQCTTVTPSIPAFGTLSCNVEGSKLTITNNTNETVRVACWQFECDKKSATYQQCLADKCEGSNGQELKQATLLPGQSDSCTASSGQLCTIRQVDWMITGTASAINGCWAFNRNCPDPYICQTTIPQCRGLRVLINKGGNWVDVSETEKNNLPSGTIIRLALPKNINGTIAEKASFQVLINNVNDFVEDTANTMDINGQPYFYKEITTKLKEGISFSNYQVYGWLFINGAWR